MTPIPESRPFYIIDPEHPETPKIDLAALRKLNILIGGPAYDGAIRAHTKAFDLKLQHLLSSLGISHAFQDITNESDCPRGRNTMAAYMLYHGFTNFLSRDADLATNAEDIIRMLACNLGVVGKTYPKKGINWWGAIDFVRQSPALFDSGLRSDELADQVQASAMDYVLEMAEHPEVCNGCLAVKHMGDGMMLFQRRVFETLIAEERVEKNRSEQFPELEPFFYGFFNPMTQEEKYLTCDYAIALRWRECGGKVWLYPHGSITHWGLYGFKGDISKCLKIQPNQP